MPCGPILVTPGTEGEESKVAYDFDVESVFKVGEDLGNRVLRQYLDHVRFRYEQYWLRSSSVVHRATYNEMVDPQGRVVGSNYSDGRAVAVMTSGEDGLLTPEKSGNIASQIEQGREIELSEGILADARFMGWPAKNPYYRQAIVLAAMACELKVKDTIRRLAKPSQEELVRLILESPRDVTLAAIFLYSKGLKAVYGRSLKEDNRELYNRIDELLQIRNAIIHKGGSCKHTPADDDIAGWLTYLRRARDAFDYLESLPDRA